MMWWVCCWVLCVAAEDEGEKVLRMFQSALRLHQEKRNDEALALYESLHLQSELLSAAAQEMVCTNAAALEVNDVEKSFWIERATEANPLSARAWTNLCVHFRRPSACQRALEIDATHRRATIALETLAAEGIDVGGLSSAELPRRRPLDAVEDVEQQFPSFLAFDRLFVPETPPYLWRFKSVLSKDELLTLLAESGAWTPSETTKTSERWRLSDSALLQDNSLLEEKTAKILGLDLDVFKQRSEPPQLVRYQEGGYFKEHSDYLPTGNYKFREATLLYYLTSADCPTNFDSLSITPVAGDALLFINVDLTTRSRPEPTAMHSGTLCPPNHTKVIANVWFRLPP